MRDRKPTMTEAFQRLHDHFMDVVVLAAEEFGGFLDRVLGIFHD